MVTTVRSNGHAAEPVPRDPAYRRALGERGMPVIPAEHALVTRAPASSQRATDPPSRTQVTPGRQTQPTWPGVLGSFGWNVIPRRSYNGVSLMHLHLNRMQPHQVMDILADISPDVSLALHNMLLMTNSGYTIEAVAVSGDVDTEGQRIIDDLRSRVNTRGGGLDALIDQFHYSTYLHGAQAGEIALTAGLREVEDIYAVAPWTIEFVPDTPYPRPVQRRPTDGKQRELNQATFWYLPWMPAVDDPYGRLPFASVLYPLHFDLQLLYDLQVAVHSNAWDRLDIEVLEEVITAQIPENERADPEVRARWVNAVIADVREGMDSLRPDDNFIHTSGTKMTTIAPGNRGSAGIAAIFKMLERRIIRALKQLPILMGSNEGTTETHGTIQFEIWVDGLRAVQQRTRDMLEGMFTLALQVHGRQSHAVMTWEPIRTTDRAKDASAEAVEIANEVAKRDQGWITQDDASQTITGSAAVEDAPTITTSPPVAFEDDDGDNRRSTHRRASQGRTARLSVRTFEDMPAYRDTEAELAAVMAAYFGDAGDAFPADSIAAEAQAEADDDNEVALALILALVARWYDSPAGRRLADALIADLVVGSRAGYNRVGQAILDQLGIDGAFDLTNRRLIADLEAHVASRVTGFDEASQRRLARTIRNAVRSGSPVDEIAAAIRGEFRDMAETRAALIAQTECLPGETVVDTAVVRTAYRRWYEGPMVDIITASGRQLSATPNHPMLTNRGWLAAGEISEGDDLICHVRNQDASTSGNPDVETPPATIAEIFNSLTAVSLAERKRCADPDFHGDGMEGDVDVLRPGRELPIGTFAPLYKPIIDQILTPSDTVRAPICGGCGRLLSIDKQPCLCRIPQPHTGLCEAAHDDVQGHLAIFGDASRRFPIDVATDDLASIHVCALNRSSTAATTERMKSLGVGAGHTGAFEDTSDPLLTGTEIKGNLLRTKSGIVELDSVVAIRIRAFVGHVYNLSTPYGYFTMNGAYTGNTVDLVSRAVQETALRNGVTDNTWITANDDRVDPPCPDNEGVTVAIGDPFPSGDAHPPAHPRCRCSIRLVTDGVTPPDDPWTGS